jgi:hypothetical protein
MAAVFSAFPSIRWKRPPVVRELEEARAVLVEARLRGILRRNTIWYAFVMGGGCVVSVAAAPHRPLAARPGLRRPVVVERNFHELRMDREWTSFAVILSEWEVRVERPCCLDCQTAGYLAAHVPGAILQLARRTQWERRDRTQIHPAWAMLTVPRRKWREMLSMLGAGADRILIGDLLGRLGYLGRGAGRGELGSPQPVCE